MALLSGAEVVICFIWAQQAGQGRGEPCTRCPPARAAARLGRQEGKHASHLKCCRVTRTRWLMGSWIPSSRRGIEMLVQATSPCMGNKRSACHDSRSRRRRQAGMRPCTGGYGQPVLAMSCCLKIEKQSMERPSLPTEKLHGTSITATQNLGTGALTRPDLARPAPCGARQQMHRGQRLQRGVAVLPRPVVHVLSEHCLYQVPQTSQRRAHHAGSTTARTSHCGGGSNG